MQNLEKKILEYLKNQNGASFVKIANFFNINRNSNRELSNYLFELRKNNLIEKDKEGLFYLLEIDKKIIGELSVAKKGFGFIKVKEESFFVSPYDIKGFINGDTVESTIYKYGDNTKAIINKLVNRKHNEMIALISKNNTEEIEVKVLNAKLDNKILIENLSKDCIDQFVVLETLKISYDGEISTKIVKLLGHKNDPYSDINSLVESSKAKKEFSNETIAFSKKVPSNVEFIDKDRIDLRNELIVTIDGEKTKDFDDAISIKEDKNGNIIIGVYIADVAYYVKNNDPIDIEARLRGTSIYLIDKVIPMLPEVLSNGICSLNPNVDRNVLALEATLNNLGDVTSYKIFPAIINSKFRLTYKEVNEMNNNWIKDNKELFNMLEKAFLITDKIEEKRNKEGYINLELKEPIILLDENGKTKELELRESSKSEKLIEILMVLANELVAKKIFNLKIPSIYRTHDLPSEEKLNSLNKMLNFLGLKNNISKKMSKKELYKSIKNVLEKRNDDLTSVAILRTMSKAKYTKENTGHFGLNLNFYTHFTSPIRRYPDLIVHRIIRELIFNKNIEFLEELEKTIDSIAKNSSEKEEAAVELERLILGVKTAQYYENKIGQKYYATIVNIKKFGIFVEFKNKTNALIPIETIFDSKFEIGENDLFITNGNKKYSIGQNIHVKIDSVNYLSQKINVSII